jgi:alkyl sulfatase BDS1-like metallo-beta-lactamase superfamily hydrolase
MVPQARRLALASLVLLVAGCGAPPPDGGPDAQGHTPATAETAAANAAFAKLPLADLGDFDDANRGLVASEPGLVIRDAKGNAVWDTTAYGFLRGGAPPEVNPSLWRQAQLNDLHGLFEVVDGIWQVRGYDVSNITLIRGRTGWIVVDPLTTAETAGAAIALARKHLGDQKIVALVITHSHLDHFGGADAVVPPAERAGVKIVAPKGFVEEATSENVLAGVAMGRRAAFMYGMGLARGPRGHVDTGLGKAPARGTVGFPVPTDFVDRTPQPMEIDGVRFVFQYVPDSEAPAELTFYLPDLKAFCGAEIVSHTMHNLYTLRGAKVRDGLRWSGYIDEALRLFGDATEVVFASHNWPVWGNARVQAYLAGQRDMYKFIHDQTLRLANTGATPQEIAERLEMPSGLRERFATRGYYGTLRHNAKAVYQWYFGWYDGNPANLDPLPPVDAGRKYVDAMGGAGEVKRKAREAFDRGEYRWVAMLLNHAVLADSGDREARELLARAYDQLGYQAESGPWRDVYLSGAFELRHGPAAAPSDPAAARGFLAAVPLSRLLDAVATRIDATKADSDAVTVNLVFTDVQENHILTLANGVLHHRPARTPADAPITVWLTRDLFIRIITRQAGLRELVFSDDLDVDGSRLQLLSFLSRIGPVDPAFPIVTR